MFKLIAAGFLLIAGAYCLKPVSKECHLIQTRDIHGPCYLQLTASPQSTAPSFVFYELLPKSLPGLPCALLQTLDPQQPCYTRPTPNRNGDSPAFILRAPLPPNADSYDINLAQGRL